jgi:hypothetical protein
MSEGFAEAVRELCQATPFAELQSMRAATASGASR